MNELIEVYKGDTVTVTIPVTNAGVDFPLTGYTCRFLVKTSKIEGSVIVDETAQESDISGNAVTFNLPAITYAVGNYIYQCVISKVSPAIHWTVSQGNFSVLASIE